MEIFRKLAGNIFFKIVLGFVALSFVMFGVSGFILGNPNSWVAKVGSKTITLSAFNRALNADKQIILNSSNSSQQAINYVNSNQFKSDALGRMVNALMIENLQKDFQVFANKKVIFRAIAKDPNFKNSEGKFDLQKFENFLKSNNINEAQYVQEMENEIVSAMILQTIATNSIINYQEIILRENFRNEKRFADIVKITKEDVKNINISQKDLEEFFAQNKFKYQSKELRQVKYVSFAKENFANDLKISDSEIYQFYQENQSSFMTDEKRNFYHIIFKTQDKAEEFSAKIKNLEEQKRQAEFVKLADKDLKKISMNGITKRDLYPSIADDAFALKLNEVSAPSESPLGFHVFLLNEIRQAAPLPFSEVKASIKNQLSQGREDKIIQQKITKIDEEILANNSLEKAAKKFNLGKTKTVILDENSHDKNDKPITELENFAGLSTAAFSMKEGQVSKIFYAKNSSGFYILQLEKITPSRQLELKEVAAQVKQDLLKEKSSSALKNLANKVLAEINKNPQEILKIAKKYGLKFEKNREIPRMSYLELNGRKIPFQSALSENVFDLKINQNSNLITQSEDEFVIALLTEIKKAKAIAKQLLTHKIKQLMNLEVKS